ncbi:hypothetical protein GCM10027422_43450 [Hymenobacter arcticus]
MNKEQLVAALFEAVHPNGENGHGKTTAFGLRDFLSTLIDELMARTTGTTGTGTTPGTGTGTLPGGPAVLASPHLLSYRLTVTDAGELGTVPANDLPLQDPLDVLTSPNGLSYRLTVADDGHLRAVLTSGLVDPDAAAFGTAAGLANTGHQEAVNQLVRALKISNVWPKLRALYPMVGGTARAHALNLKDPRDDDAAFRLTFPNGATHSALGAGWDGATQYADTHLVPAAQLFLNSCHLAYYATTTSPTSTTQIEIGCLGNGQSLSLLCRYDTGVVQLELPGGSTRASVPTALGLSLGSRPDGHTLRAYRDGVALPGVPQNDSGNAPYPATPILLAHRQDGYFSDRTCGLASVGEGLSPAEVQAYAEAVRAFQQALGRDVALDPEALAFVQAAGLTDPRHVAAVGELVRSLKASGVWPRLRAAYPMVGGTEQAHRLNLIDPRDADSAFRLTFVNSPVHTAQGLEWRASASTYADTHLVPHDHLSATDHHLAYYAVTDSNEGVQIELGCIENGSLSMLVRYHDRQNVNQFESCGTAQWSPPLAHGLGFTLNVRERPDTVALYRDGQVLPLRGDTNVNANQPTAPIWLGGRQNGQFSQKTCGFASIGYGLTPAQAGAYAAAVRAFQQALGRDVTLRPELLLA